MSGQLIGGVAGAAIGFYLGGPPGAQIGWAAGSMIGGALDPTRIDGPHLADRKVQVSTYGAAIPILYGGTAGSGNVIWSTDLVEHDVESEGKGTVTTSHTYTVSCAVLIGEGPIPSIRRIWADAKLVYDVSDSADSVAQAASAAFAQFFTFYQGTEDQLPDPTIEAALGAGEVPAYRGCCYIVFTDLPLEAYGNRIPNFKFEVSTEPTVVEVEEDLAPLVIGPWIETALGPRHFGDHLFRWDVDYDNEADAIAAMLADQPLATIYLGYYTSTNPWLDSFGHSGGSQDTINDGHGARYVYLAFNVEAPDYIIDNGLVDSSPLLCALLQTNGATPTDNKVRMYSATAHVYEAAGHQGLLRFNPGPGSSTVPGYSPPTQTNNCTNYDPVDGRFPVATVSGHRFIRVERVPSLVLQSCEAGLPSATEPAQVPGNPNFCISIDGDVTPNYQYVEESGTWLQLKAVSATSTTYASVPLGPTMLSSDPRNTQAFWEAEAAAAGVTGSYGTDFPQTVTTAGVGSWESTGVAEGAADLADIVTDICTRAGMPAGSPITFDVSALVGIEVQGFAVARQMPARQAILPLQQAFWWDFVESGRQIKAVLRGASSAVTIGLQDMGAAENGQSPVAVIPTRGQEAELPAVVSVAYPSRAAGYEPGTQRSRRVVTGSQQQTAVEMPVVMTDQRAANVADVLLYAAWTNRTERTWATTRKFAKYEPTDIVTLDDDEFTYQVRIIDRAESGGVIAWKGVDELPAAYDPNATPGNASGNGISGISFDGPTNLMLLDCPIVSSGHDDPGHYAAAAGYRPSWPGGTALKSVDGGSSYATAQNMPFRATIGYADTALGDWTGGNMVDEANTVDVRLHSGTVSSISASALLNGGNTALLGDEIIRFRTATLIEAGLYRLSGLLRARQGTEQHTGSHVADERFVLFNANVYRVAGTMAELDVAGLWKGVTYGQSADAVTAQSFTNTGIGLKPLAPVHLYATDIGGGEYRLTWVRRTRLDGKWRDIEVPLGETTESYTVEVLTGAVVQSTATTSATTLDVTADPGDVVNVYQMSSTIGRGFPATVTLT